MQAQSTCRNGRSGLTAPGLTRVGIPLLMALYASRVGAEFILPTLAPVGAAVGLLLGVAAALWLRRKEASLGWQALLVLPYMVLPYQDPALALACGLLAAAAWMVTQWDAHGWTVDAGVFVAALALYTLTLAPGVQPADGGEFQFVIAGWGVAHPPGYPLYTVLGGLLARLLPIGSLADRVNLFSAITGALTLAVICRAVRQETRLGWAGVIAAGMMGTSASFWTTATQASIRPMSALFTALLAEAALAYRRANREAHEPDARRALLRFGMAAGLGVTHHASLIFPGSVLALAILAARPRLVFCPREWLPVLLAALAGTLPWAYLLLRGGANAPLAPPNLTTWEGFWQHVTAAGFGGDMFYYRTLPEVMGRLQATVQALAFQWNWLVLALAVFALAVMIRHDRWLLLALGGAFGIHALVASTYHAPQTVEYLIPAYVCLAIAVGWATGTIQRQNSGRYAGPLLAGLGAVAIVWSGWPVWISLRAYQQIDRTESNARAVLEAAPPESMILANWHHVTALWAVQAIDGLRPDVETRYVAPAGTESILDTWARLIREDSEGRPLLTCSYYPEVYRHLGQTFSALESCWRVGPASFPTGEEHPIAYYPDGETALYRGALPENAAAGEAIHLTLFWEIPGAIAYGQLATFVHLVDGEGRVLAQDDQPLIANGLSGQGMVEQRYTLYVPRTTLPGDYRLYAGVYRPGDPQPLALPDQEGLLRSPIALLQIAQPTLPPVTGRERHVPFGNEMILIGYDYDLSAPGRARLYLHWQITAPTQATLSLYAGTDELTHSALPAVTPGFLTTAHDLPDTATVGGLWLEVQQDGETLWARGAWGLPLTPGARLDGPLSGERYLTVGEVVITRVDVQATRQPGSEACVLLTIRSSAPVTEDMTFKLALGSTAQSENVPVRGAIPTLKWGWGATVTDTLCVHIPEDSSTPGPLMLTLYDSFTSRVWPILDPVLRENGPSLVLNP